MTANSFKLLVLIVILSIIIIIPLDRAWADEVIATIEVGDYPLAILYNPSNKDVYVVNSESDTVSVIDSSTNEIIKTIEVGDYPWSIGYNPNTNTIYVSDRHSHTVSVIDGSTNEVIKTLDVGNSPFVIAFNPVNNNMYVSNQDSHSISVIDGLTNDIIDTIENIDNPQDIVFNPNNDNLYVSSAGSNIVNVINSLNNEIIKKIGTIGSGPYDLEYNPSNNYIYIGNSHTGDVSVLDTSRNEVIERIDTGGPGGGPPFYLNALTYNPENGHIYVSDGYVNYLSVIDSSTNEIVDTIEIGRPQYASVHNPSNNHMYVGLGGGVAVIDSSTNEVVQVIDIGIGPVFAIEYNPANEGIYSVNNGNGDVSVIAKSPPVIVQPIADAGLDQTIKTNDVVQLDGSNSSDPNGSRLSFFWNQLAGPEAILSDSTTSNPTFLAPEVNEQTDITFQLTVTNEEGIASEPDEVIITVNPVTTPPPDTEPTTIADLIRGIIQNPLDITNSVESANEIRDILTDDNPDNDEIVCDLIKWNDESTSYLREILNC